MTLMPGEVDFLSSSFEIKKFKVMSSPEIHMTHAIFDLDGLLINTEDLYTQVFDDLCFRWVGKHFDVDTKQHMMGRRRHEALSLYKETYKIPLSVKEIETTSRRYLNELLPLAEFMPGARRLVEHLYRCGIPMAIATGSDTQSFACKTSLHRDFFNKHFELVVLTSDPEVQRGKPAPDIFQIAASRFKNPPTNNSHCFVFEDAVSGVKGGLDAGMSCVWVPSIPNQDTTLQPAQVILGSLDDFNPECFGLPPFGSPPTSPCSQGR